MKLCLEYVPLGMNPNNYENQKIRGQKRKLEAIMSIGGKCSICGYSNNISALEFHHINPDTKEFNIDARKFANTSPEKLKEEISKCLLVCSNCHKEIHNPDMTISNITNLAIESPKKGLNDISGKVCPTCGKRFPCIQGKIYCSFECRMADKHYPTLEELNEQYSILRNWDKVAEYFGVTRKITQGIRKRNS